MRRFLLVPIAALMLSAPFALTAKPPKAVPPPAPAPSASPSMTPEEQRAKLNAEEAIRAQQQVDENVARELNNRDSARDAAARQREYEAAKARYDAQVVRYQAEMEKWKADVAACQAGDRTRCAKAPQ